MRHTMTSKGGGLDANDTLIAAQALALDAVLVTADTIFGRVLGLRVENWLANDEKTVAEDIKASNKT